MKIYDLPDFDLAKRADKVTVYASDPYEERVLKNREKTGLTT